MPNTALPKSEIKRRYAIRRRRQKVATLPVLVVLVLILIWLRLMGTEAEESLPPAFGRAICVLVLLWLIGFSLFNWRCPRCNAFLGKWSFQHCSNCGVELR